MKRGEDYKLNAVQQELEDDYIKIVLLLNKAGYPSKYIRLWTWQEDQQPGYISLEKTDDNV